MAANTKTSANSTQQAILKLRADGQLLTPEEIALVAASSQRLHDGDNPYAQSLTGALHLASMFGCRASVLREVEFARTQPQLFNVFLGACLALRLGRDIARPHYETLITPLATTPRLAWLKEVLPA